MTVICDTSGLLAAYDAQDPRHEVTVQAVAGHNLVISPLVLAEVDYMLTRELGQAAAMTVLRDVANGALVLETFSAHDVQMACEVIDAYKSLELGIADASNVVLAARYGTTKILTFDQRDFRAVTPLRGGDAFKLLPLDATA